MGVAPMTRVRESEDTEERDTSQKAGRKVRPWPKGSQQKV